MSPWQHQRALLVNSGTVWRLLSNVAQCGRAACHSRERGGSSLGAGRLFYSERLSTRLRCPRHSPLSFAVTEAAPPGPSGQRDAPRLTQPGHRLIWMGDFYGKPFIRTEL